MAAKKRPGEGPVENTVRTVGNSTTCQCPQPDTCVLRLQLPPPGGSFHDGRNRRWTVVRRDQAADPVTGQIGNTTIKIRRIENGEPVDLSFTCAGPLKVETRYEKNRLHRPPRPLAGSTTNLGS
ncbi:hypothetical protein GCM10010519_40970 [Streptomyces lactacystinicus]